MPLRKGWKRLKEPDFFFPEDKENYSLSMKGLWAANVGGILIRASFFMSQGTHWGTEKASLPLKKSLALSTVFSTSPESAISSPVISAIWLNSLRFNQHPLWARGQGPTLHAEMNVTEKNLPPCWKTSLNYVAKNAPACFPCHEKNLKPRNWRDSRQPFHGKYGPGRPCLLPKPLPNPTLTLLKLIGLLKLATKVYFLIWPIRPS